MLSNKLSATGLIALTLCLCCAFAWKSRAGQDQRSINIKIEDYPQAFQNKEPVKIIGLYLGTTPLESGEDFQADKDWLHDLRIMVKNVSDQSIRNIILNLDMKTGDPNVETRRIDIHYGRGYLYSREPIDKAPEVLLAPGQLATFGYNTNNPKAYSTPGKGVIFLGAVVFEDIDKGWYAPTYAVRCGTSWCADPDKPYRVGRANNGAHMLKDSLVSRQPEAQDEPKDLTISRDYMTVPPLTILNARRTDEGLTVELQNTGRAPIEYFELHLGNRRVQAGRNSLTEVFRDNPRNLEQEELSLAPEEVRTFQFPVKRSGDGISVEMVLLSNGQGWFKRLWLKKLDNANENGMLWTVDNEETRRKLVRGRIADIKYFIK